MTNEEFISGIQEVSHHDLSRKRKVVMPKHRPIEIHASSFEIHKIAECPLCESKNVQLVADATCPRCKNVLDFCNRCFVKFSEVQCPICDETIDFTSAWFLGQISDRIVELENELENVKAAKEWDGTADTLKTISQMTEIKTEKLNPFVTELMSWELYT